MVEINVNFYSFAWVVVMIHMNNIVLFCSVCSVFTIPLGIRKKGEALYSRQGVNCT